MSRLFTAGRAEAHASGSGPETAAAASPLPRGSATGTLARAAAAPTFLGKYHFIYSPLLAYPAVRLLGPACLRLIMTSQV